MTKLIDSDKNIGRDMNEFEVILVKNDLANKGIAHYEMRPGNDCIWVNYGLVNCYYIFRNGKIADIQID